MKRRSALMLGAAWLAILSGVAGSTLALLLSDRSGGGLRWVSSEQYQMLERYERIEQVRATLEENYYLEVDEEALLTGAICGMMSALDDPYTFYYTQEEMQEHKRQSEGAYVGIGVLVQNNGAGEIEVIRVYEGSPAEAAGVRAGDALIGVDGREVRGTDAQSLSEAVNLMQGEAGSEVRIRLRRGEEELELRLERGEVSASSVSSSMLPGEIGYIEIAQFSGDDVRAFSAALDELEAAGARALVIDLRNNPGGLLDDVVQIADRMLPEGLIVYTEDRSGRREDYYSDAACCELPLAVLVNEMSASASEIFAAAVKDHGRGFVVGVPTYGKGVVQTLVEFESGGAGMQYTSACYYTPSGQSIQGTGVEPDVCVEADADFALRPDAPDPEADSQLRAAMDALADGE